MADIIVNADIITTLRRRLVDKLCKDNLFALSVIHFAMRKGKIKYIDLMTEEAAAKLGVRSK